MSCGGLSLDGLTAGDDDDTGLPNPGPGASPQPADGTVGDGPPIETQGPDDSTTGSTEGTSLDGTGGPTTLTTMPPMTTMTTMTTMPPPTATTVGTSDTFTTSDDDPTDPPPEQGFGDCINEPVEEACLGAESCLFDDPKQPSVGVCKHACDDVDDCPEPPPGNATVLCADIDGDVQDDCVLFCGDPSECPDGMVCFSSLCVWPQQTDNYADCLLDPEACGEDQECLAFDAPPWSVCSATGCDGDPGLCPEPPPGGTAPAVCDFDWDTDGVSDCTLDCSAGQTCPFGMSCQSNLLCAWAVDDLACADVDLGSLIGEKVAAGNTFGEGDDAEPSCTVANADDVILRWTAPAADVYSFDLSGSDYDTILMLWAACDGPVLGCNDDAIGVTSQITIPVAQGQSVLIVIDGFDQNGNWVLSILN